MLRTSKNLNCDLDRRPTYPCTGLLGHAIVNGCTDRSHLGGLTIHLTDHNRRLKRQLGNHIISQPVPMPLKTPEDAALARRQRSFYIQMKHDATDQVPSCPRKGLTRLNIRRVRPLVRDSKLN
jgi:hypothetical protein